MRFGSRLGAVLLAFLVVASAATVGIAATADSLAWSNQDADAPNPYIDEDKLTVDTYEVSWDDPTKYYNDNGEVVSGDFTVNESVDNPYTFDVTHVNDSDLGEFPRKDDETGDNSASALDASEWSKDASGSAGSGTVADATPAEGVEAVQLSTSSQTSGDVMDFTYSNVSITSDATKRVVAIGADISTLDSGANVSIQVHDADADYVEINASSSLTATDSDVLASSTGDSKVVQERISDLAVQGGGDGSIGEIQEIRVRIEDADADVTISWLDAGKKSVETLGTEKKDNDSDDDLENVEIEDTQGPISVYSLDTLPTMWDDAAIHGLEMPVKWRTQDLGAEDVEIETSSADKYQYDQLLTLYARLEAPGAIDLTHSGLDLMQETNWPESRYVDVDVVEGSGDTDFEDVEWDNSGTDVTSKYSASNVTIDDTVQTGTEYAIRLKFGGSSDEIDTMLATGSAGGGGIFGGGGGGPLGFLGGIADWVVGGLMGLAGLFGLKRAGS